MTSLVNEFMQIAQNYSDLLEDTEWRAANLLSYIPVGPNQDSSYSDLLEDTDWQ
tara:strand:- start:51 stop:212 length:162 start_codon:yes stop_codon:yes gene_type:complete